MDPKFSVIDFRDFWFLTPEIILSVWGLIVLLVDLVLAQRMSPESRRRSVG